MIITQMMTAAKANLAPVTTNLIISADTQNYVLNTAKVAGYVPGSANITLTINSGIYVGSSSIATPGLVVDNSWAAGDVLTIINNGYIVGAGGFHVYDWNAAWNAGPDSATAGGPALAVQRAVTINNNGTIGGGGGGGGGSMYTPDFKAAGFIMSGGGGQGYIPGPAGLTSNYSTFVPPVTPVNGAAGTKTAPGAGGAYGGYYAGSGGTLGASGQLGYMLSLGNTEPANILSLPGAGGYCTTSGSNANITWTNTGTRLGTLG